MVEVAKLPWGEQMGGCLGEIRPRYEQCVH